MGAADTNVRAGALQGDVVLALSRDGREELRQPRAGLSLPQRKLLTLIDGRRSLREIAAAEPTLHADRLASDAARLLGRGLVEIEHGQLEPITRPTTLPPRIAPAVATTSPPRMAPNGATTSAPRTSAARTNEAPALPRQPVAGRRAPRRKVATWLMVAAVGAVGVATGYLLQPGAGTTGAVQPLPSRVIVIAPAPAAAEANETAGRAAATAAEPAVAATTVAAAPALPRSERDSPAAAPAPRSVSAAAPQAERPVSPSPTAAPAPRNVPAAAPPTERATSPAAGTAPAAAQRSEREPPAAAAPRHSANIAPPVEQTSSSTAGTNAARPAGAAAPAAEAAAPTRATVAAVTAPAANGAPAEAPARPEAVLSRPSVASTPAAEAAPQGIERRSAETAATAAAPLAALAPAPSRSEPAAPAEAAAPARPAQPDVPVWAREFAPLAPDSDGARGADAGGRLAPIERIPPAYPRDAVMAGISRGSIRARAHLAADGRVERVELQPVDSNSRYFERSARAALMTWLFPPGERGRVYEVTLNFVAP
jgi:outer membrane biosynthesis protein TonB